MPEDNLPPCLTDLEGKLRQVRHAQPLVGLFVGVTSYSEASKLWSTPAHAIGAALFMEPFYLSARTPEKTNDLRLVTDLAIDRRTDVGQGTEDALRRLRSVQGRLAPAPASKGRRGVSDAGFGGTALLPDPVFRGATAMGRDDLLRELDRALAAADATAARDGRVTFILYVAAHGRLGSDGRPYILPSNALPDDPSTWIEQRRVVARVGDFLARSRGDGLPRRAILVFDICRHFPQAKDAAFKVSPTRGLANALVMEGTAPQTYAWQWTMQAQTHGMTVVTRDDSWSFPFPPPKARRGPIEIALASRISIVPMASTCSIGQFFEQAGSGSFDRVDPSSRTLSAAHWALATKGYEEALARLVPEMAELGEAQQLQLHAATNQDWLPLLEVIPR